MRRPTRWTLLATVLLTGSCHGGSEMGVVEVELFDEPVECDAETETCFGAGEPDAGADAPEAGPEPLPREVEPEPHRTWVFYSDQSSAHEPGGAYLYFELVREDDVRAYVEIDVPTREGEADSAVLRYTEYRGDVAVFDSDDAWGRVELAEDLRGRECECPDGRLELVFRDAGEDDELGTGDDRVRRLSSARFSWNERFCIRSQMLGMRSDRLDVSVRRVDRCPSGRVAPREVEPRRDDHTSYHGETGCSGDDYGDSGGSGGGCEGDSSSSGGGCEGDSSSGGGCEGDSSSGGGCEGDTGGGSSGCSGDTGGGGGCSGDTGGGSSCSTTTIVARDACPRVRPARPARILASARAQLVLGIVLALAWLHRRRRPAARRARTRPPSRR